MRMRELEKKESFKSLVILFTQKLNITDTDLYKALLACCHFFLGCFVSVHMLQILQADVEEAKNLKNTNFQKVLKEMQEQSQQMEKVIQIEREAAKKEIEQARADNDISSKEIVEKLTAENEKLKVEFIKSSVSYTCLFVSQCYGIEGYYKSNMIQKILCIRNTLSMIFYPFGYFLYLSFYPFDPF